MRVHFTLNGSDQAIEVDPLERALDVLRRIGLTGTKEGCGEGECGSCTIMMDARPVNSCLVIASQLDGRRVLTVEGLAADGALSPLQQAFVEHGATQCGICTPGILMAAEYLLAEARRHPAATGDGRVARFDGVQAWATGSDPDRAAVDAAVERDIRTALAGNICRCTGYDAIVRAVKDALRIALEARSAKV